MNHARIIASIDAAWKDEHDDDSGDMDDNENEEKSEEESTGMMKA